MAEVRINVDHTRARAFSAEVTEKMIRRAMLDIKLEAIKILSHGPYTSMHLMNTLDVDIHHEGGNIVGRIGSHLPYAASVEAGAQSHYILPHPPKTRLKFYWRKVGRVVTPPFVYHPGQRGKSYLRHPLRRVAARYNMLVFTYQRPQFNR